MSSNASPELDSPHVSEPGMPAGEIDRAVHTRLRRRILYGQWREDLRGRIVRELQSEERADSWGEPDISADIFTPACEQLATLYTPDPPRIGSPRPADEAPGAELPAPPEGSEELLQAVSDGGFWEIMIRGQRDTIGLREMVFLCEPDGDEVDPALSFVPIFPDRVVAYAGRKGARDIPAYLSYAMWEAYEGSPPAWYWHEWNIDGEPYYRITKDSNREIVVHEVRGSEFPYFDALNRPVIPAVLYHAERTGYLWDPWQWQRVVEGALRLAVKWTFFGHLIRNAAWPLRYMLGAFLSTESNEVSDLTGRAVRPPRIRTVTDPAVVVQLAVDPESAVPPSVGSFPPGADPLAVAQSIEVYERRILGLAGLDSAAVSRKEGDARSGYALAVSDHQRQELRARYAPTFRRSDLQMLRVAAVVYRSMTGKAYPETGYEIEYGPEQPVMGEEETPAIENEPDDGEGGENAT